ncbi:hypothetical protein F7Q99_25880 [Streptomyces kaniharaensis]|uniref:Uncharacterized protein n=1 Tax=Streptomyces kaniharaensis TaxID=212423 RepID=A0A6N7KXT8_9ACTN|nr:hypothetical protein [Streptomyces kaniharaensis]MQS15605.1 hypothetical protein [Streptomyces kaniharaensis]
MPNPPAPTKPDRDDLRTRTLAAAGALSLAVGVLHLALPFYGGAGFRYFGAGEYLARLADHRSPIPTATVVGIATLLAAAAAYAWSAAGLLRPLPGLASALTVITAVYLLRGLALLPEIPTRALSPTSLPLRELAFSAFALTTGLLHLAGLRAAPSLLPARIRRRLTPGKPPASPGRAPRPAGAGRIPPLLEIPMPHTSTATSRRWPLWTAATLAAAIAALHLFGGTPEFVGPLVHANLDAPVKQLFRVLWHMCTLLLASLPVALAWAARAERRIARPVLAYVWFIAAAFTVVFFVIDLDAFGAAVFTLPQWTLFIPLLILIPLAT